jgi:hypothetical protein
MVVVDGAAVFSVARAYLSDVNEGAFGEILMQSTSKLLRASASGSQRRASASHDMSRRMTVGAGEYRRRRA